MSQAVDIVFELSKMVAEHQTHRVVLFSELAQHLGRRGLDWSDVGVEDWEATHAEIVDAPALGLYLALTSYGHVLACTAGRPSTYVNGQQVPGAHYEELRSSLTTLLEQQWPTYVRESETFRALEN